MELFIIPPTLTPYQCGVLLEISTVCCVCGMYHTSWNYSIGKNFT